MDIGERVGHRLVLATTRVGKTRLAELLITRDIRRGDVVVVFDPKGDADLLRRVYAEARRAGRARDFYLFYSGYPQVCARYNAVGGFSRITEVATRVANPFPGEGNSAAFKAFAWRFVNSAAGNAVFADLVSVTGHIDKHGIADRYSGIPWNRSCRARPRHAAAPRSTANAHRAAPRGRLTRTLPNHLAGSRSGRDP